MKTLGRTARMSCAPRARRWLWTKAAQTALPRARAERRKGNSRCFLGVVFAGSIALFAASRSDSAPPEEAAAPGADAGAHPAGGTDAYGDDELLIREVFNSHLPRTLRNHALRLGVHPHLGDLNNNDHLRITTGVRYGLTKKLEISASSDLYFSHGYGEVPAFDRYGAASFEFGAKINLGQILVPGWEIGAGFEYEFLNGRPPAELTDGLRHFRPYITFSRRLESHRGLRVFWGLRVDEVTHTSVPGEFGKNHLRDSSTGITGGFVIDRKNWHYTFEASADTTRLIGHTQADIYKIRPGVIWEILSRRHPGSRSNWVIGAAVSGTFGPGGDSLGGSLKVRYSRNLKNRFRPPPSKAGP